MTHLLPDPDDQITITVRRSHLVAALSGTAVYVELIFVNHLAVVPAAAVAALMIVLSRLRQS
ncbi:hypothetical protein ACIRH0_44195 [Streptomyces sp. NPDC093675]|uniref:hypothetical protein n=1 Tax=Streptomyces sp. NPDC093675 TaxID=3366049 RepID=UPI00380C3F1F